jgi:DNA-binding transcriptional ArsR family regulator
MAGSGRAAGRFVVESIEHDIGAEVECPGGWSSRECGRALSGGHRPVPERMAKHDSTGCVVPRTWAFPIRELDTDHGHLLVYNHMVVDRALELSDREVDRIFGALADATRRDIVRRTLGREASVSELASAYDMSFAAVQKHVAVLEGAGLVTKHPHGRERMVRGNLHAIQRAQALLERYEQVWRSRIERLDELLADTDE